MFYIRIPLLCRSCLLSSDRISFYFYYLIFSAHPIVHRPFPIFLLTLHRWRVYSLFPKTLKTACSCSASRISTLCFTIFFLQTLPTPQRLSRFCFSGCRPSCLKSRQTAVWQNESKRWGSIPFHSILTSPSAFWRPNRCSLPGFYISLIFCINYITIEYYITK